MGAQATIPQTWIVAFSGHRPGLGAGRSQAELEACRGPITSVLEDLRSRAAEHGGSIELLVSAAAGADLVAGEVGRDLGIPVHVIAPMPLDSFKSDFDGLEPGQWERAQRLIDRSRSGEGGGTFRIAGGDNERPACYHECNLQVFEIADALVAVWNGEVNEGVGGTAEFVTESSRVGLPVVVIDPARRGHVERRGRWDGWPGADPIVQQLTHVMEARPAAIAPGAGERAGQGPAWELFARLDRAAVAAGSDFRRRLLLSLCLHFAAALLAAFTASFTPVLYHGAAHDSGLAHHIPKLATGVELVLVSVAAFLMWQAGRGHSHGRWRTARFAAELVHGLLMSARLLDPLRPMVARHDHRWKRFALAAGLTAFRSAPAVAFEERRRSFLEGRVRDQIRHFSARRPAADRGRTVLGYVASFATVAAPPVIALALVLKFSHGESVITEYWAAFAAAFLPVVLPLVAGTMTSLMVATDAGRRAERYKSMEERLGRIAERLPGIMTEGALRRVAVEAEDILLGELVEWYVASKHVGH